MTKILIYINDTDPGMEYDIWDKIDNKNFFKNHVEAYGSSRPLNFANKLWLQSLISCLTVPENEISFYSKNMSAEYINENFDKVICPQANLFSTYFLNTIKNLAEFISKMKIPVYMIACGVQAGSYFEINDLVNTIGEDSKRLINVIYSTGGEFALRGNITKEFFDKIGYNTAVVTGCPSMYQNGRNLKISNLKVKESEFKPVFNGNIPKNLLKQYESSYYIDQETYFEYLYNTNYTRLDLYRMIKLYGYDFTGLLLSNRIKLFVSMNEWHNFLIQNKFSLSVGTRIHGNIISILSGVPALICPKDIRVKEMAEFYSIPTIDSLEGKSLYNEYQKIDYSNFNETYPKRFDSFNLFLKSHGLVKNINEDNIFFNEDKYDFNNSTHDILANNQHEFEKHKYVCYSKLLNLIRKIKK